MRKTHAAVFAIFSILAPVLTMALEGEVFVRDWTAVDVRIYESQSGRQVLPPPGIATFRASHAGSGTCPSGNWKELIIGLEGSSGTYTGEEYYARLSKEVWYTVVMNGQGRFYLRSLSVLPSPNDAFWGIWPSGMMTYCSGGTHYQVLDWPSAEYGPVVNIHGPSVLYYKQQGTFTAVATGGSFPASSYQYEWRTRLAGQTVWSEIKSTAPTYTRSMFNQSFEVQVTIRNPTDFIGNPPIVFETVDTHYVNYGPLP